MTLLVANGSVVSTDHMGMQVKLSYCTKDQLRFFGVLLRLSVLPDAMSSDCVSLCLELD